MRQKAIFIGGGTFSHVRNHLALCAPAFGTTALQLSYIAFEDSSDRFDVLTKLTKMANSASDLVTNEDVTTYVDKLLLDMTVKIIVFNAALCDFTGQIGYVESGKHAERLKTAEGQVAMIMTPADKVLKRIRKERKDIFLVAFKTTTGATEDEQYLAGLNLLKANSVNLVLANDTVTRMSMIIVPEEARYCVTADRHRALATLWEMTDKRSALTFTRSTVIPGGQIAWNSSTVPETLRRVVNECIRAGAYKPFRGATAGHFAFKVDDKHFVTSKRKTDYNELDRVGMVMVEATGPDSVTAYGAKPSVGGQSQRIVFAEHPEADCIVHFHCPPKHEGIIPVRKQQFIECGSHECGKNTSDGLLEIEPGIKAVYLENHGPNIVFNHDIDPDRVIDFIHGYFDLSAKTGGLVC